ncbi:hypothetical protein Q8F55_001003 [Vanrija albida]|uniref:Fibronectin type-III domain-containing protein n=1 Tax=Vanrija albida TaxID=181172 RepID=A0ABR3QEX0_9TREE
MPRPTSFVAAVAALAAVCGYLPQTFAQDESSSSSEVVSSSEAAPSASSTASANSSEPTAAWYPSGPAGAQYVVDLEPNLKFNVSIPTENGMFVYAPDSMYNYNLTAMATYTAWNVTYDGTAANGETGVGEVSRGIWAYNASTLNSTAFSPAVYEEYGTEVDTLRTVFNAGFIGNRIIIHGTIDQLGGNENPMNLSCYHFVAGLGSDKPPEPVVMTPRVERDGTVGGENGTIFDTGFMAWGSYNIHARLYAGRLRITGYTVFTGLASEAPSMDKVVQDMQPFVVDGWANPAFETEGNWTVSTNTSGNQTHALNNYTALATTDGNITIPIPANTSFIQLVGVMGPSNTEFSLHWDPYPPARQMNYTLSHGAYSPYRNLGLLYAAPLNPNVTYSVKVVPGVSKYNATGAVTSYERGGIELQAAVFMSNKAIPNATEPETAPAASSSTPPPVTHRTRKWLWPVVGVCIGLGVILLALLAFLVFRCCRRSRKPSPIVSDPTPFEIEPKGEGSSTSGDEETRLTQPAPDAMGYMSPNHRAQVTAAKAHEAAQGRVRASGGGAPPPSAFVHHSRGPPSAVPSSVLDPMQSVNLNVPHTPGPTSTVASSVLLPVIPGIGQDSHRSYRGEGSVAASSSLEPDMPELRSGGSTSTPSSSNTWFNELDSSSAGGSGSSHPFLANNKPRNPVSENTFPPVEEYTQEEDAGVVESTIVPPSYNPSWAPPTPLAEEEAYGAGQGAAENESEDGITHAR